MIGIGTTGEAVQISGSLPAATFLPAASTVFVICMPGMSACSRMSAHPQSSHAPSIHSGIELARTSGLVFGIDQHLLPLRHPANRARQRVDAGARVGAGRIRHADRRSLGVDALRMADTGPARINMEALRTDPDIFDV